ncbi:MAG TPA: RNA polymerase sigma factor [Bacteroidota bacterium]|nr:RNA polymerase sigma factor [Bacteroidota bacterium]
MTEQTDPQLIESFRNGNEKAFNQLVARHQERIYWVARRILGSHEDADDVVQEVFLRVFRKLHTFRGNSEFFTWLYRIAVNLSLNASKRKKVADFFHIDALHERQPADGDNPETLLMRREEQSLLDRAVVLLPEKQKAVFTMRYHEGMKFERIASILGRSVGGVKSNYFHAVRKIDRFLKERHA